MTYEISDVLSPTLKWPRFGIGASTGSLYFQRGPYGKWVSMEGSYQNCDPTANITPVHAGAKITFTQE